MKKFTIFSALLLAPFLSTAAQAHDTWLIPDQFKVAAKSGITLDLTSGMEFPKLDTGPKPERVEGALCRLAGQMSDVTTKSAAPNSLQFKTELVDDGIATIWVELPNRSIELKPEEVKEYLDEVDAPEALRKQWAEMKDPRWRESYSKHAKTFVQVGDPDADLSWQEPVGLPLEIVPEKDPTALKAGDDFPVRVLKQGKPFANFSLNAIAAGETKGETRKTDAEGRATFRLGKKGRWLFRGTDIRKSSQPDTDWESDFTTLTLEVKEK